MYDTGFSMAIIQKELGDVSVQDIRRWAYEYERNKQIYENKPKKVKHKKRKKKLKKKKKLTKAQKLKDWKRRVFASWKDTPEQQKIRLSPEYQEWRKIVLERDNYTCQHCQKTGGKLVVHHIKTFKMNPELRTEPDNGIVLCNDCHEELHLSRMAKPKILRINRKTG